MAGELKGFGIKDMLNFSREVFIPEDTDGRRQADEIYGYIHPCASFPISDLVLEVPDNK